MGYFATFAAITTILFALLLYFLRYYLPLRTPVLFLIVLTSFLLTMMFPFMSSMLEWHNSILLFASFIIPCVFVIYLIDQNGGPTHKEVLTKEHKTGGPVTVEVKDLPQQKIKNIASPANAEDASHDIEISKISATDSQQNDQVQKTNGIKEPAIENSIMSSTHTEEHASDEEALDPGLVKANYDITAPIFNIIQMDKLQSVIEIPGDLKPGQINMEHKEDALQQDNTSNQITTSDNQEEHEPVPDGETQDKNNEKFEENVNLSSIIAKGFSLRLSGNMVGAVNCFMDAMHFSSDAKLNVKLGLEISAIYNQMGQRWQAAEILKILFDTWGDQLEPQIQTDLISNMKRLQK
ncbi:MAG: hypothetical protein FH756_11030 [Firmicutes bacterium]|nr:hypothetical protein [Bacillota bacterium]